MTSGADNVFEQLCQANQRSAEELLTLLYEELRKIAAARMAAEAGTSTLQPTALVHEAWLRLRDTHPEGWQNRAHFFAAAAEAMRRILVDNARRKRALKRGARAEHIDLDRVDVASCADELSLLAVDEALTKLAGEDPEAAEVVKLRFFVGMNYQEAALAMGMSLRSAKRCWSFARAWLYRELSKAGTDSQ